MNKKHTASPPMNVGISLLLVVFLILCLFTFAAIALTSAKNEYENSLDMAERTTAYYNACNEAERTLNELSASVARGETDFDSPLEYSFDINDSQSLEVRVEPNDSVEEKIYRITRWQVQATKEWKSDDTMNVLTPKLSGKD